MLRGGQGKLMFWVLNCCCWLLLLCPASLERQSSHPCTIDNHSCSVCLWCLGRDRGCSCSPSYQPEFWMINIGDRHSNVYRSPLSVLSSNSEAMYYGFCGHQQLHHCAALEWCRVRCQSCPKKQVWTHRTPFFKYLSAPDVKLGHFKVVIQCCVRQGTYCLLMWDWHLLQNLWGAWLLQPLFVLLSTPSQTVRIYSIYQLAHQVLTTPKQPK